MIMVLVLWMCPVGIAVALIRRYARAVPAGPAVRDDIPARLLRWAAGLLSAERAEWGQAMLGELDHIDGRGRRWRFAAGCAGAALLLPPWGRAGAAVWAMATIAASAAGLYGAVAVQHGLGAGAWVWAVIILIFLAGFTLAASTLLRRPGIAVPGLLGGLCVAVMYLAMQEFTFAGVAYFAGVPSWLPWPFAPLGLVVGVPFLVGVAGTLWTGGAVAGRRVARLAAVSAGLGLYLYGTVAVAVIGASGPAHPGFSVSYVISDRLGNNVIFDLVVIPLMAATIGWAGAAATARLRPGLATSMSLATDGGLAADVGLAGSVGLDGRAGTAAGPAGEGNRESWTAPQEPGSAIRVRNWQRTACFLLLFAVVAAGLGMAFVSGLSGR